MNMSYISDINNSPDSNIDIKELSEVTQNEPGNMYVI